MEKLYLVVFFTFFFVNLGQSVRDEETTNDEQQIQFSVGNSTRRGLTGCPEVNIIDACWRGRPDWDQHRQDLAYCAAGFAAGTTGGLGGEFYTVTDPSDDDPANPRPGTLRFGVVQNRPLWIIFERDMYIRLRYEMGINSDKTIDGRGVKVEIVGTGLSMRKVRNIIIHGIDIHDTEPGTPGLIKYNDGPAVPGPRTDGDGICVTSSCMIWIDHCTFSRGADGLVDVVYESTDVTVSNCLFSQHNKVLLFGACDAHNVDTNMRGTVAFNWFGEGCGERMPRCRFGLFQVVNNNYDPGWGNYAIGGSVAPTILSQGNRFHAPPCYNHRHVLHRLNAPESESMTWNWRTEKDLLLNGAVFVASGVDPCLTPEQQARMIPAEPGECVPQLTAWAGSLTCFPGQPC